MRTYILLSCQAMPMLLSRGHTVNERTKGWAQPSHRPEFLLFEDKGLMGSDSCGFRQAENHDFRATVASFETLYNPLCCYLCSVQPLQLKR